MTVATEACYAERAWTGVETSFVPGFPALAAANVLVDFRDASGAITGGLTLNVHYAVALDGAGLVTITPIALPPAPGTLLISRVTPATQAVDFAALGTFAPQTLSKLFDAAEMGIAEGRQGFLRTIRVSEDEIGMVMPRRSARVGALLGFNLTGDLALYGAAGGVGNVLGPAGGAANNNQVAVFDADGNHLKAGGVSMGSLALLVHANFGGL